MSLRKNKELSNEQRFEVAQRFGIAQDGYMSEEQQERLEVQKELRSKIYDVGLFITSNITLNSDQMRAMSKLEEALMWGGKAIFKEDR